VIRHANSVYGASAEGVPLTVHLPEGGSVEVVVLAAIHGDEAETKKLEATAHVPGREQQFPGWERVEFSAVVHSATAGGGRNVKSRMLNCTAALGGA